MMRPSARPGQGRAQFDVEDIAAADICGLAGRRSREACVMLPGMVEGFEDRGVTAELVKEVGDRRS